jgi:hypothetical protein
MDPAPRRLAVGEILELFGSSPSTARAELASLLSSGRAPVSDTIEEVRRLESPPERDVTFG